MASPWPAGGLSGPRAIRALAAMAERSMPLPCWGSGSTAASSLPVTRMATRGCRKTSGLARPSRARVPMTPALTTVPARAGTSPRDSSSPWRQMLRAAPAPRRMWTVVPRRTVSSSMTTPVAPTGRGAPVMIRQAVPGRTTAAQTAPAGMSPISRRATGQSDEAPATSAAMTA